MTNKTSVLDTSQAKEVAFMIHDMFIGEGFKVEELIPGYVQAIIDLAQGDEALLDDAARFLADGGVDS